MKFHKLGRAKDSNFWSLRVSRDIRIIVHRSASSLLLCYVGHHDDAYAWAERRKIERHPTTGAAQLVELRERVEEIGIRPLTMPSDAPPALLPSLFAETPEEDLLRYGVPAEWIDDVRAATEDTLLDLTDHLPQEAAEALLDLAVDVTPEITPVMEAAADPFEHPDAQRRFRVLTNVEELERALDFPWEKWTVFLHPVQRRFVERSYSGPARIAGSAGTGKTIVALHRAVHLARQDPDARILLTTFSKTLANALATKLARLAGNEPAILDRITVRPIAGIGYELYENAFGQPNIASPDVIRSLLGQSAADTPDAASFSPRFLFTEWSDVVDAWRIESWEAYQDVPRLGRRTRLGSRQRQALWAVFEQVRAGLTARGLVTWSDVFGRLADRFDGGAAGPFDFAVIDEAQDVSVAQLRFLAALGGNQSDGLFFAGDLGQRIFQTPFSWMSLGIDVRGRSHTLRVNYRTSHQIRRHADRLLPVSLTDVDGVSENRHGTVSVFNGPEPMIHIFDDAQEEAGAVGDWIGECIAAGIEPHEIGVFVRSRAQLKRARDAVKLVGARAVMLSDDVATEPGHVSISTMHLAKGLEFRAVVVMACDDEVVPLQERIEAVGDEADLEEVYDTERHLLYVACTRARDHLLVSGVDPAS